MSTEQTRIPDRIDEPMHFLFWRMDEVLPIGIGLVAGILLAQLTLCLLGGIILARFYRRFCDNKPDGYLLHGVYWHLGTAISKASRSMPNAYKREFI